MMNRKKSVFRRGLSLVLTICMVFSAFAALNLTAYAASSYISATTTDRSTFRTGFVFQINNVTSAGASKTWNENSSPGVTQVQVSSPVYLKTYQTASTYGVGCSTATLEVDRSKYDDIRSTGVNIMLQPTVHTRTGGVRWGIELFPYSASYTTGSLGNSWNTTTVTDSAGVSRTYTLCNSAGTTMASAETSGGDFTRDATTSTSVDITHGPYYWYLKGAAPAVGKTAVLRVVAICVVRQGDNNYQMLSEWTDLTIKGVCSHSQGYNNTVTAPTCTAQGYTTHVCKTCGYTYTDSYTSALTHSWGSWTSVSATQHRRVCGRDGSHTETANHSFTDVVTAPTCTAQGYTTHSCAVCGYSYKDAYTEKLAHDYSVYLADVSPATCFANKTASYRCANCDATLTKEVAGTKLTHSFTSYEYNNDATCDADGTETAFCDHGCGATHTRTAEGTRLTHSFTSYEYNNDATCDADGTETASCDHGCGETHTRTAEGTRLTHSFTVYVNNNDAVCDANGTETAFCDHGCGETHTRTAEGTRLTHSFTAYEYNNDATCDADGTETASCDHGCGETHTRTAEGTRLTHSFTVYVNNNDAVCDANGTETAFCDHGCGATHTREIPDSYDYTKHSTTETVTKNAKAATCYEDGYTGDIYCAACDHLIEAGSPIAKETVAHMPVKTDAKDATCTEKGNIEYYTCSECGRIFTEEACENEITAAETVLDFDYTNHSTDETVLKDDKAATCYEDGYTGDIYCAACDHLIEAGSPIAKETVAHTPVKTDAKAATCTEKGNIEYYTCSECGRIFTEEACENEITAEETVLDFDYENHSTDETVTKNAKAATCNEDGYTGDIYCKACGRLIEEGTVIPSAGAEHVFGEWYVKTAAKCLEDGEEERVCANCGATETRPIPALGHDWGEWTDDAQDAPSCTKDGKQNRVCARCGETETREITASEKGHTIRVPNEEGEGYCASCGQYRCLFCEKDEHMHEVSDSSIMTFFVHVVHYFYHLFSNFRYTLSHN